MSQGESTLILPSRPAEHAEAGVPAWRAGVMIDSYLPVAPDRYPASLDRRVYQGSSGRVYPLPFHDRISPVTAPAEWDFFYRNPVIKPALVGLTGPWISGGVEFNWPQHLARSIRTSPR